MKVWVLTGDKIETAINIGISCKLLDDSMRLSIIDGLTRDVVSATIERANADIVSNSFGVSGVVVSGDALIVIMSEE